MSAPGSPYPPGEIVDFDYFGPISGQFWLGTDYLGRDILSRILAGARYTVGISLAAVVIACASGVVLGMTAAVIGGWLDTVLSRLLDALNSIPSKLFGLVVVAGLGSSIPVLIGTSRSSTPPAPTASPARSRSTSTPWTSSPSPAPAASARPT